MDKAELKTRLRPRPVKYFASTGSTNDDARAWLDEKPHLAHGAVVIADEQVSGKGRLARSWVTPPGSAIAMSVILRGMLSLQPQKVTMAGAVAVAESLEVYAPVVLKWPNDVLLDGKKVCGILAEGVTQDGRLVAVILGMGINISVDFQGSDLADIATSLQNHTEQVIDRVALIGRILEKLEGCLREPGKTYLKWKERLATLNEQNPVGVTVHAPDGVYEGVVVDVDAEGALVVALSSGEQRRFLAGDVSLRASGSDG